LASLDALPPKLDLGLRANRSDHTLADTHGQIWMQLVTLAKKDPDVFQGSNTVVEKEMVRIANLNRDEVPVRRLVTLWMNHSWGPMITRWCSTAIGSSLSNLSLWGDLSRFRVDDVSTRTRSYCTYDLGLHRPLMWPV
jgi:hypothetical protein